MMNRIRNFFYPNKGILGAFAVWAVFNVLVYSIVLPSSPSFELAVENPSLILVDVAVNLLTMYALSCLSIWVYEKMKKK